jgi:sulfur dioxygenase
MLLKQLFDQDTCSYTYLLADETSREAAIIDPVRSQISRDTRLIDELGLNLIYILDTHVHADHITGAGELRRLTGALSCLSADMDVECVDQKLHHGDRLKLGAIELEVRSTPGHTPGCLTYVVTCDQRTYAFTGDTLLIRGCGRTDFQEGNSNDLYDSVHQQIFSLPDDTLVYPGHDYKGHTSSSVKEEKQLNPRLNLGIRKSEFNRFMTELRLANPTFMDITVPANLNCGQPAKSRDESTNQGEINESMSSKALDGRFIVDVREPDEFNGEQGHLLHAVLTPLGTLKLKANSWPRDVPIMVVCCSGRRSQKACVILNNMGFSDVSNLDGGMTAWSGKVELGVC